MKNLLSFVARIMASISGSQKKIDTRAEIENTEVDRTYEIYVKKLGRGGYVISDNINRPFTLVDKVNIELSYASYKASQRLRQAIQRFDESSTKLAKRMLVLTIIMAILVSLQVWIMLKR